MQDVFTPYETGLTHLLRRLGKDHPRYTEALTLQSRLLENIVQARRYGDTETRRAERAQIIDTLNNLSLDVLGKSFNELCGLAQEAGVLAMASLAVRERGIDVGRDIIHSILITGDHNVLYMGRPPTYHAPFQAPPLPAYFVPRPDVSESLKAQLLADGATSGALVVSAIHGLGGIGKSTLAAALAHDSDVQARFPDGVLWATLGQQPEILSLLMDWIQALGDYGFRPTTVETATAHLRTLLHAKAALLVVDDAWNPAHARPFLVGGSRCRVLVTTREAVIAKAVGAALYDLDVMTPEQALALLAGRLGRDLAEAERERALELAQEVGYLPLALELAAAQVADGVPWDELLADLRAEVARLETLELPEAEEIVEERERKRLSLLASFYLSLRRLPEVRREAFAWLGVLPEDVTLTPAMMATVWRMEARRARDTLRYLRGKALLLPGVPLPDGTPTYRLHDLLHDLTRRLLVAPPEPARAGDLPGLGLTLEKAHALLLERYRARTREGSWHTLPDDGYIHAHLTWHMEKAGQVDEIHALLREETAEGRNGWYEARERLGQTAGYLADVARAWRLAEEEFAVHHSPSAIGFQCRYALITVSLNSLAKNVPPDLLAALVEEGMWTPAQGLAYARRVPYPWQRSDALARLAPHFPGLERERILGEALAEAQMIELEEWRASTLTGLASSLSVSQLREALTMARAIQNKWQRAKALAGLAPHLPGPERERALQEGMIAARAIRDEYRRADALTALIPHLPVLAQEQALREVLAIVWAIQDQYRRVRVWARLIPYLPDSKRGQVVRETLQAARAIQDRYQQAKALTELAPNLPEPEREQALQEALVAAQAIQDEFWRAAALAELAPYLPEPLLHKALEAARMIELKVGRATALAGLAPNLPEPEREQALREALKTVRVIGDEQSQEELIAALTPHLPNPEREQVLREALVAARLIEDAHRRSEALTKLIPHLLESEMEQALREALAAARAIQDGYGQAKSLAMLAPYLPKPFLGEALTVAKTIGEEHNRLEALVELVPFLSEPEREQALREALASAKAIQDKYWRATALGRLAFYLPEPEREHLLQESLEMARLVQNDYWQARALAELTPRLGELGYLEEALATVNAIKDECWRTEALARLVPWLAKAGHLKEALAATRAMEDEQWQAVALAGLAPYLPELLLWEAFTLAQELEDEYWRGWALAGLTPRMAELGYPEKALAVAQAIRGDPNRVEALARLAPHLTKLPIHILYPLWQKMLPHLARRTRKALLADLSALASVIVALGGSKAVIIAFHAVQDVGRWWP